MAGDQANGVSRTLDQSAARCVADPVCAAAVPDPVGTLNAALEVLADEPVVVEGEVALVLTGLPVLRFDPVDLVERFVIDESNPHLWALARGLETAADADERRELLDDYLVADALSILAELFGPPEEGQPEEEPLTAEDVAGEMAPAWSVPGLATQFSDGMNFSVICAEEYPYRDGPALVGPSDTPYHPAVAEFAEIFSAFFESAPACAVWDVEAEDSAVTEAVRSDVPTLVLGTDVDFQTWPEWTAIAAEALTNSYYYEFPNLGHVVAFYDACPQRMIAEFLGDPATAPDDSCIAGLEAIRYAPAIPPFPPFEEILEELFGPAADPEGGPEPVDEAIDEPVPVVDAG